MSRAVPCRASCRSRTQQRLRRSRRSRASRLTVPATSTTPMRRNLTHRTVRTKRPPGRTRGSPRLRACPPPRSCSRPPTPAGPVGVDGSPPPPLHPRRPRRPRVIRAEATGGRSLKGLDRALGPSRKAECPMVRMAGPRRSWGSGRTDAVVAVVEWSRVRERHRRGIAPLLLRSRSATTIPSPLLGLRLPGLPRTAPPVVPRTTLRMSRAMAEPAASAAGAGEVGAHARVARTPHSMRPTTSPEPPPTRPTQTDRRPTTRRLRPARTLRTPPRWYPDRAAGGVGPALVPRAATRAMR